MDELWRLLERLADPKTRALLPGWLPYLLLFVVVVGFLWKQLGELIKASVQVYLYFKMGPADRERIRLRQRFAQYVRTTLLRQDEAASWNPRRFTELEAEYYAGLDVAGPRWRRWLTPVTLGPRRLKALSRALAASRDPFALLEGDPGSGKSVILRKVAAEMCADAATSSKRAAPVALYMNLKGLERPAGAAVDPALVRAFVVAHFKRLNNPELTRYVDTEFEAGITEGRWLFLFDSFDEIPEVLGAEDASEITEAYANALFEFATTFSGCRTILATRYFRRPRQSALPKYRILPLSDAQRETLVERANLPPAATQRLYGGVSGADAGLRYVVENPMYLGLLIEYVRADDRFPGNPHQLFAQFVDTKLESNAETLRSRYGTDPRRLRDFAELIAFTIVADAGLGLNPRRNDLVAAAGRIGSVDGDPSRLLDALEHLQLARGEPETPQQDQDRFTFSHRRFQEYFTTCYVLRVPTAVAERDLLVDARWRETAVVLLSTGAGATMGPMMAAIAAVLAEVIAALEAQGCLHRTDATASGRDPDVFPWPPLSLHLLGIVQDGFVSDPARFPDELRATITTIVQSAFAFGRLADRRVALEVAGALKDDDLLPLLRSAITFGSQILDDVAFRQVRRVTAVPADLSRWIRVTLIQRAATGRLRRERRILLAFLSRVRDGGRLFNAARLLSRIGEIDLAIHVVLALATIAVPGIDTSLRVMVLAVLTFSALTGRVVWYLHAHWPRPPRPTGQQTPGWSPWRSLNAPDVLDAVHVFFLIYVLVMRAALGPVAILIAHESTHSRSLTSLWVGGAALALTLWTPMAVAAVFSAIMTERAWWPWLPVFPVVAPLLHPVAAGRALASLFKRFWVLPIFCAVWGFLGIFGVEQVTRAAPQSGWLLVFVPFGIVAFSLLLSGIRRGIDWHRLRRFRRAEGPLPVADFREALDAYYFNSFRVRFIRFVAARTLIPPSPQGAAAIRDLTLALERDLRRRSVDPRSNRGHVWRAAVRGRLLGEMTLWDQAVLDELSRLEERLAESLPPAVPHPSKP